jgi:hypothetical protein
MKRTTQDPSRPVVNAPASNATEITDPLAIGLANVTSIVVGCIDIFLTVAPVTGVPSTEIELILQPERGPEVVVQPESIAQYMKLFADLTSILSIEYGPAVFRPEFVVTVNAGLAAEAVNEVTLEVEGTTAADAGEATKSVATISVRTAAPPDLIDVLVIPIV